MNWVSNSSCSFAYSYPFLSALTFIAMTSYLSLNFSSSHFIDGSRSKLSSQQTMPSEKIFLVLSIALTDAFISASSFCIIPFISTFMTLNFS